MRSIPHGARTMVWALPRSLAATYGITCCFLFLRLLRCFSSAGSRLHTMDSCTVAAGVLQQVSPFRDPRIEGYLHLPAAFRSLSRLSSALSAKASTLRSFCLTASRPASVRDMRSFGHGLLSFKSRSCSKALPGSLPVAFVFQCGMNLSVHITSDV